MTDTKGPVAVPRRSRRTWVVSLAGVLSFLYIFISLRPYYALYRRATQGFILPPLDGPHTKSECDGALLPPRSVAIIGAGSAGASTAYYLSRYAGPCQPLNMTVFERSDYVGGRSTTVHLYDDAAAPVVELGASIFVEANRNLVSAYADLGLELAEGRTGLDWLQYELGVWDGARFRLLIESDLSLWWMALRMAWKYGTAPLQLLSVRNDIIGRFLRLYESPVFPFRSLGKAAASVGLDAATSQTGTEFLAAAGVGAAFAEDIVQSSTRVNYAADLPDIHGLETLVSMSAEGAMSIAGGNWRIFQRMLEASGAAVQLSAEVEEVARSPDDGSFELAWSRADGGAGRDGFDAVVLAAPWDQSAVKFNPPPANLPQPVDFVHLHVAIFTSPFKLRSGYFDRDASSAPGAVLTTLPPKGSTAAPPFQSISMLRSATNPTTHLSEFAYKVFSLAPLDNAFLANLLDTLPGATERDAISWRLDKEWLSYPVLHPTTRFFGPEMSFTSDDGQPRGAGLWYTGGIEPFVSTMETSSLAGKNVAALLAAQFADMAASDVEALGRAHAA